MFELFNLLKWGVPHLFRSRTSLEAEVIVPSPAAERAASERTCGRTRIMRTESSQSNRVIHPGHCVRCYQPSRDTLVKTTLAADSFVVSHQLYMAEAGVVIFAKIGDHLGFVVAIDNGTRSYPVVFHRLSILISGKVI